MDPSATDEILHLGTRQWALRGNDGNRVHKLVRIFSMDFLGASELKPIAYEREYDLSRKQVVLPELHAV